jgi:hypothetical protein
MTWWTPRPKGKDLKKKKKKKKNLVGMSSNLS